MSGLGLLGFSVLLLALLLGAGLEVAFAIGIVAVVGLYIVDGSRGFGDVGLVSWRASTSFALTSVPLFVLLGTILFRTNLSAPMFDAGLKWFSWLRGGPLIGTLAGVGVFSAISGSSSACAATFGTIAVPELETKRRYNRRLVLGTLAAGASLDIMIPPSLAMIIYASVTDQSVGKMFAAGVGPGILLLGLMSVYVIAVASLRPEWCPRDHERVTWPERFRALWDLVPALILMTVVLGGIYLGIMTPTESAAVGCAAALAIAFAKRQFTPTIVAQAFVDAVRISCFIMLIVVSAYLFGQFASKAGFPATIADAIADLRVSRWIVLALIILLYVVLGAVMESIAILTITLPLVFPTVVGLGFDPLWFGIITVIAVEMSLILPPLGLNLFIIQGVSRTDSTIEDVFVGALPFVLVLLLGLVVIAAAPEIALWLPRLMQH